MNIITRVAPPTDLIEVFPVSGEVSEVLELQVKRAKFSEN